jgi:hypothetical protein
LGVASVGLIVLAGCSGGNTLVSANVTLLASNSTATRTAQAILYKLNHGDLNMTVPNTPCSLVTSGDIGSLKAPYNECPVSTAEGHFVTFATKADPNSGLAYTDRGAETFLDECYALVRDDWFVWMKANLENPAQPCPGGWRFHGGP